jgi:hypothetical protein
LSGISKSDFASPITHTGQKYRSASSARKDSSGAGIDPGDARRPGCLGLVAHSSYRPRLTERPRLGGKAPDASRILGQKTMDARPLHVGPSLARASLPGDERRGWGRSRSALGDCRFGAEGAPCPNVRVPAGHGAREKSSTRRSAGIAFDGSSGGFRLSGPSGIRRYSIAPTGSRRPPSRAGRSPLAPPR